MSFVLQRQPGAITDLMSRAQIITGQLRADGQFSTPEGQPLYFLGISPGVGTCARGRSVPVAVFGLGKPGNERNGREELLACAFAVLARAPTRLEREQGERQFGTTCLDAVELLDLVADKSRGSERVLRPTKIAMVFVNTL